MPENEKTKRLDRDLYHTFYQSNCNSLFDPTKNRDLNNCPKFYSLQLSYLEQFVDDLLSDDEIPFVPCISNGGRNEYHPSELAGRYFIRTPGFIIAVNMLSPNYEYSERINAFIAGCQTMGIMEKRFNWRYFYQSPKETYPDLGGMTAATIFNHLVDTIRKEWKTNKTQAKLNARKNEANQRYVDYCRYADALFNDCARLLVLRIDLFYKKDCPNGVGMRDITEDLNHLLENKRCNSMFDFMKGYIAKLEYGIDKGFHWHVIFFFDGSKRNNSGHIHLAENIGQYWEDIITPDRGAYWNVNANAHTYEKLGRCGIAVINWDDDDLRSNLKEHVIGYLCKVDQFIKPKCGAEIRRFRRGNPPKTPRTKRGKPRKQPEENMTAPAQFEKMNAPKHRAMPVTKTMGD